MDHTQITRLLEIMAILRGPEGCPWDAQQTPQSLKPYLLEEAYEVLEALDEEIPAGIREELGDLLLQVVFLARIFEERGEFTFEDVAGSIADKLVRRHPHVFAGLDESDFDALHKNWDRIKAAEKDHQPQRTSLISPPPRALPALQRAQKVLTKMSRYDLPHAADDPAKDDALSRLQRDLEDCDRDEAESRLSGFLLDVAEVARRSGIDAEGALRRGTDRLVRKTQALEESLDQKGTTLADADAPSRRRMWRQYIDEE
ncbi:MAG: nucleoside triphosphate pyrophosphohydrolase [Desulfuromonadales bacterium]